jgi:hypothetical protein
MKSKNGKIRNNDYLVAAQSRDSNGAVRSKICKQVSQVYDWIDSTIKSMNVDCSACGKCCDFGAFGHKLFITSPEFLYFSENLKPLKSMAGGICPYLECGKCAAREFRFAGCRIFFCKADNEKINELSEQAIKKFKAICEEFDFPYSYTELAGLI